MLHFVDFIVKAKQVALYPRAQELLEMLKKPGVSNDEPERTALLASRLSELLGGVTATDDMETIEALISRFEAEPRRSAFSGIMLALAAKRDLARARRIARIYYTSASAPDERYSAIRGLADHLATSDDSNDELEALEMYRYLLEQPEEHGATSISNVSATRHNYATLLNKHGYSNEAGRQWRASYEDHPGDTTVRRALALWLARSNAAKLAEQVIRGQSIDWEHLHAPLFAGLDRLPPHFVEPEGGRWWERQPEETEPPPEGTEPPPETV